MKSVYYKLLAVVFCFAFLSGNVFAQDAALKEKFQAINNQMVKDMLADNTEAMMALYADDAISLPSYEPMLKGKNAMMESHKRNKEAGMKMNNMTLKTMDVWTSGDFAYEIGTYTIDMSMPEMGNWKDNGKYITIWQKQSDDSWKIKADMWNTDNNPWADMKMSGDKKEGDTK